MKSRLVIDLGIFNLMLKELRSLKREIRALKGVTTSVAKATAAGPRQHLQDKIASAEAMRILKVTPATLIKYEAQGLIKFHKEGRNKIYSKGEILAFKKAKGRRKRISKNLLKERFLS
jgi:hypothetical protein